MSQLELVPETQVTPNILIGGIFINSMSTIRVILALASINRWYLHQLDVSNAFLHGDLLKDVYMAIPPDVNGHKPSQCCKLQKSLYGLKQASHKWRPYIAFATQ